MLLKIKLSDMSVKRLLILALVAALVATGCQQAGWTTFSSREGGFSVLLPSPPTEQRQTVNTVAGPIEAYFFVVDRQKQDRFVYTVAYSDYPDAVVEKRDPGAILDGARDGAVKNVRGRLLSELSLSLGGHPGREINIAVEGTHTIRARLYLVNNRLYQVSVLAPSEKLGSKNVGQFLDSFTLLTQ